MKIPAFFVYYSAYLPGNQKNDYSKNLLPYPVIARKLLTSLCIQSYNLLPTKDLTDLIRYCLFCSK